MCDNTGNRTTAAVTPLSSNIVSLSARGQHFLASESILAGGDLLACGRNGYGELGNGTTTDPYNPITVSSFSSLDSIAAAPTHSAVLDTVLGTTYVWTWGRNAHGQLGDGTTTNSTVPLLVFTY